MWVSHFQLKSGSTRCMYMYIPGPCWHVASTGTLPKFLKPPEHHCYCPDQSRMAMKIFMFRYQKNIEPYPKLMVDNATKILKNQCSQNKTERKRTMEVIIKMDSLCKCQGLVFLDPTANVFPQ